MKTLAIIRPGFHILDHDFAGYLTKQYNVILFIPKGSKNEYPFIDFNNINYNIVEYNSFNILKGYPLSLSLYNLLRKYSPDIINGPEDYLFITWLSAYYSNKYSINFIPISEKYFYSRYKLFGFILYLIDLFGITKYVWNKSKFIISHGTETTKFLIKRGCPKNKIIHLHTGYNPTFFKYYKHNYLLNNSIKIISVGRLIPHKGYEYLIKGLSKVSNKCELLIIGKGYLKESLLNLAKNYNIKINIIDSSKNSDIQKKYFDKGDLYICSSIQENSSVAAVEAIGSGLPLISTNIGSTKDYVLNNKTGFIYSPYDEDFLGELINKIYSGKIDINLFYENLKDDSIKYNWNNLINNYIKIFG